MALVGCTGGSNHASADAALDSMPDSAEGSNVLRNSDFEQLDGSGWVTDWQDIDTNPNGQIVVVDTAHSGAHAIQWQMDAAGDGREYWVTQHLVMLGAGPRYAIEGWYFVDAPGDVALNYIVSGQPGDTPVFSTVQATPSYPKVVGEWAPFRFELTLPVDPVPQSWDVSLHSIKFNGAATKLTLDDVKMVELSP